MDDINTAEELRKLVEPALSSKCKEINAWGCKFITNDDIWNIMIDNYWTIKSNIALCDIVDDILNINNDTLYKLYRERDMKNNINKLEMRSNNEKE